MRLHYIVQTALITIVVVASSGFARAQFDARVQAIHNAPDPELEFIDLYVEDMLALDDVGFQTASPFIDVPGLFPLTGGIAPGNSTGPEDVFFEFTFTLAPGDTYQFILQGVRDPGQFLPNPDGRDISLDVLVNENAKEVSDDPSLVDVVTLHGGPDAPTLDVLEGFVPTPRLGGPVVFGNELAYGDYSDYVSLERVGIPIEVATVDGTTFSQLYEVFLVEAGDVVTILMSGFLDPAGNQNGPEFAPLVVFADGTSIVLEPVTTSVPGEQPSPDLFRARGSSPNPFTASTSITFDLAEAARVSIEVYDVFGRRVLPPKDSVYPAGTNHEIQIDGSGLASGVYVYHMVAGIGGTMRSQNGQFTILK